MGMLSWAASKLGLTKPKRRYEAAAFNRLNLTFLQTARSINAELKNDLDALRRRSRNLAQNEPLAKKFLSMVGQNVVGAQGVRLQVRIKEGFGSNEKSDTLANDAIERGWKEWACSTNCDVSGRLDLDDMSLLIIKSVAKDGEALIRIHRNANNKFKYALQVLDIERLDTQYNREGDSTTHAIVMGVELDGFGKPAAYYLVTKMNLSNYVPRERTRIDANDIIHLFVSDFAEQVRGVPWMHASMIRIHNLKGFEDAALIASRVGASKMGWFTTPNGEAGALANGKDETTGIPYSEVAPGEFGVLPEGVEFTAFDPTYPHSLYEQFVKSAKRDIGAGLNASYHSLANDLEGVNFSSIRSGTLEERDEWMLIQAWFIRHFFTRIYKEWIEFALLSGALTMPNGSALPARKITKFREHKFMGRRWAWVDPKKDMEANILAMDNNVASPFMVGDANGVDVEEVLRDKKRFEELAASLGLEIKPKEPAKPEPSGDDPEPEPEPKKKPKQKE